jgi:hypothetical protein
MKGRPPIGDGKGQMAKGKGQMADGQFGCDLAAMRQLTVLTGEPIGSEGKATNYSVAVY